MKQKKVRYLRLIVSLLFIVSLAITLPYTAYADDSFDGNTNSGGSTGTGNDPAYAHKFMAYPENQGYRISIVDKNGNRVANSTDLVNYVPYDI